MQIDEIIDLIDETIEASAGVPFTGGGRRLVDVDKVHKLLDDIRRNLPHDINRAKDIVADRTSIIDEANKEASRIVKNARDHAQKLTRQEAVVKAAEQEAKRIIKSANDDAVSTSTKVTKYCDTMLERAQKLMEKDMQEIKDVRLALKEKGGVKK